MTTTLCELRVRCRVSENVRFCTNENVRTVTNRCMFPPGLEPGTFRVLGERDDHYTTRTLLRLPRSPWNIHEFSTTRSNAIFPNQKTIAPDSGGEILEWVSRQENIQHHFDHHNEQKNDLNLPEYYCTGCWHGGLGSGDYANKLSLILSISRKLSNFASLHEQIYIGKFRDIWNNSAHIHIAHRMIITVIFLIKQKITCSRPGSNRGPFACKANVMTSTLRERHAYTLNAEIFCYVSTYLYLGNFTEQQLEKRRHENFNACRSSSPWVTVTGLVV